MEEQKQYELTNHLGNVFVTLSDKKIPVDTTSGTSAKYYIPLVITAQDYYPFGMLMPGRNLNTTGFRFGFNGKEKDNELYGTGNAYDYGMRMYDARLGRFMSVDPLFKKYPFYSSYMFAGDMPIVAADLDGEEPNIKGSPSVEALIQPTQKDIVISNAKNEALDALTNDAYEKIGGDAKFPATATTTSAVTRQEAKATIKNTISQNIDINVTVKETQNMDGSTSYSTTTIITPNNFSEAQAKNAQKVQFKETAIKIAKGAFSLITDIPDPTNLDEGGEMVTFTLGVLKVIPKESVGAAGWVASPVAVGNSTISAAHAGNLIIIAAQSEEYLKDLFTTGNSGTKTQKTVDNPGPKTVSQPNSTTK